MIAKMAYTAILAAMAAFCAIGQEINTNGTVLADDLTSSSRVVVDAFANSSNLVHALIQEVSPEPDLTPYATKDELNESLAVATNGVVRYPAFTNDVAFVVTGRWEVTGLSDWRFALDGEPTEEFSLDIPEGSTGFTLYRNGVAYGDTDAPTNSLTIVFDGNSTWDGAEQGWTLVCTREWICENPLGLVTYEEMTDYTDGAVAAATNRLVAQSELAGYVKTSHVGDVCIVGNVAIGDADPEVTFSEGTFSLARGAYTYVSGNTATAIGEFAAAEGDYTLAAGFDVTAQYDCSIAMGAGVRAVNPHTFAWNYNANSTYIDHGEGTFNINPFGGIGGFWVGDTNMADHVRSIATNGVVSYSDDVNGQPTAITFGSRDAGRAVGAHSLALGTNNAAVGRYSVTLGDRNVATIEGSIAMGRMAYATNNFSFVWSGSGPAYGSHGARTFSINPQGGVNGFYIGTNNLYNILQDLIANTNPFCVTNYTDDGEICAIDDYLPLDIVRSSELDSRIEPYTNSLASKDFVNILSSSVGTLWSYVYGESVWIAVTNYMRQIPGTVPSLRLWEVRDSNTNLVYSSAEEIEHVVTQKVDAAESRIMAAMPSTAWGAYQSSGVENPSPEDITVVNSPKIMLSSGYTWQKCIETGSASVWVLKANGLMNLGGGDGSETNGYFRIADAEGNAQFEVIKTSDQEVGAIATDTDFDSSNNFTIRYNSSSSSHPTLYCALALADDFEGEDANGDINNLGISVTWERDGGTNWIATVHQDTPSSSLFCHAKMTIQGTNLIKNSAPSSFDGGIYINNTRYRLGTATISGHLVLTLEAW